MYLPNAVHCGGVELRGNPSRRISKFFAREGDAGAVNGIPAHNVKDLGVLLTRGLEGFSP